MTSSKSKGLLIASILIALSVSGCGKPRGSAPETPKTKTEVATPKVRRYRAVPYEGSLQRGDTTPTPSIAPTPSIGGDMQSGGDTVREEGTIPETMIRSKAQFEREVEDLRKTAKQKQMRALMIIAGPEASADAELKNLRKVLDTILLANTQCVLMHLKDEGVAEEISSYFSKPFGTGALSIKGILFNERGPFKQRKVLQDEDEVLEQFRSARRPASSPTEDLDQVEKSNNAE